MKKSLLNFLLTAFVASGLVCLSACDDEETPGPQLTGNSESFSLAAVAPGGPSGTITFAERDDQTALVTIELSGTQTGAMHPAHIHSNSAAEGGSIILDLPTVEGPIGKSQMVIGQLNDGTPISYADLIALDGYINVHLSTSDMATIVAQGDIGPNELTGDTEQYTLSSVSNPGISGVATFSKRASGETLVTVELTGTAAGESYPSHIHANTAAETGGITINLTNVNGTTGRALTHVSKLNDGTPITYDELLQYNGYLNVHAGATLIAQGDIGQNELTGDKKDYTLNELNASGVSGTATFAKRKNGKTQITLSLTGTSEGGDHPAHIHVNDAATGGGIALDLKNVSGATGKSVTSANALKNGTTITYDELINYNGHINVHLSPSQLATRIAQGNIGSNAP